MKNIILILSVFALIASSCKQAAGQEQTAEKTSTEVITKEEQSTLDIDALLTDVRTLRGAFSVQIMASNNMNMVSSEQIKAKATIKQPVIIVLVQGLYKLYVGDFNTKSEAEAILPEVKRAGYPDAWIVNTNILTTQEINKGLEEIIIKTIKAYQNRDEETLNKLILKDFGIAFFYRPGMYDIMSIENGISFDNPVPSYLPYYGFETDYKIRFEELPDYNCSDEGDIEWNKPSGIYCDTTSTSKTLSGRAKYLNEATITDWSAKEIKKFEEIDMKSYQVIVIGKEGGVFVFSVTFWQNKWYLTIIDRFEYCSGI